ncbi:purine-binding chemotaxis protein CheW [Rhizomicrobium palustre]|uniref:Purine-binding chemotaxis protein CheW n=1 Tax=Rhizomicrobium palustre TaxID=189966 RepID=A0A846MXF0_9PROT|nr:purine-binding chemotaxis protein CheW [Rhizomicrobium palustre]
MSDHQQTADSRQYITFFANGQEFAADIMAIREIRGWTDTTALPHVPHYVRGVINLRGIVLPVIDLKAKLGLGLTEASPKNVIIVVSWDNHTTGVLVDAVSDIVTVRSSDIQPPPDIMDATQDSYVDGIAVLDGRMVTLLATSHLMAMTENAAATAAIEAA